MSESVVSAPYLGALLHLVDPTLPIGGFNHSNGLETFVQQKHVKDSDSLHAYVEQQLLQNWVYNDGAFMSLIYDATRAEDVARIMELDEWLYASKVPRELREGTVKLGTRLLKIFAREQDFHRSTALQSVQTAIQSASMWGCYPTLFGVIAAIAKIPKSEALYALYYNMVVGTVTNGVKLIPLSQMSGQDLMFTMRQAIQQAVAQSLQPDEDDLGACMVGQDIRAMQHEQLYTRLYMS